MKTQSNSYRAMIDIPKKYEGLINSLADATKTERWSIISEILIIGINTIIFNFDKKKSEEGETVAYQWLTDFLRETKG